LDNQIWSNFKKIRKKRGESLEQVASAIGINSSSLSRIENGKSPNVSFSTIYDLSRYYDISIEKLISGDIGEKEELTSDNNDEIIVSEKELPYYRVVLAATNEGLSPEETQTIINLFRKISAAAQAANERDEFAKLAFKAKSRGLSIEKFQNMIDFMVKNEETEDK